jgi:hypothetical protein
MTGTRTRRKCLKVTRANLVRESLFRVCCALKASFGLLQVAKLQLLQFLIYSGGHYCVVVCDSLPGPACPARAGQGAEPVKGRFQCPDFSKMFVM